MKKTIISLLIFMTALSAYAESINWYTEYDKALEAAKEEDKNIFVLITAPSWCIWCVRLEDNVLSKEEFQENLSENYIALKLLDKIDGQRNPELENFQFSGYPTVYLYDAKGGFIESVYTQNPVEMVQSLDSHKNSEGIYKPLIKDLELPVKYTFSDNGGGEYINNHDEGKTWTLKTPDGEKNYILSRYDYSYLYLEEDADDYHVIALPMNGTDRHIAHYRDGEWHWSDLSDVERVGGDEYFDKVNKL